MNVRSLHGSGNGKKEKGEGVEGFLLGRAECAFWNW